MKNYKESFFDIPIKQDEDGRTLVYNSNTTALSWFTPDVYGTFHDKNNINEEDLLPDIIKLGFVIDSKIDEVSKIEFERKQYLYNQSPVNMGYVIAPTMVCNMRCTYCFENDSECNETMSEADADKVVRFIINQVELNPNVKILYILWFGGEPCMAQNLIRRISTELIEYTECHGITYNSTIISNGYLLNRRLAKLFKDECGIRFVQITLDGLAETYAKTRRINQDDFYEVIDNIVNIHDILSVNIRINVTKKSQNEIKPLVRYLLSQRGLQGKVEIYFANVRGYDFNNMSDLFSMMEFQNFRRKIVHELIQEGYIDSIQHSLRDRTLVSCTSMQMMSATIGPDCNLYRCENCLGKPEYKIGTCENGFYRNQIDNRFINYSVPDACKECKYFPACATGCRAEQVMEERTVNCEAIKSRLITNIETYIRYNGKIKNGELKREELFIPC